MRDQRKHYPVYVVNPTTNQFRALSSPRIGEDMNRYAFVRFALAFDPSKSPHYKVVCVTNSALSVFNHVEREGEHHKIDMYSSETEKWKHLNIPFFESPSDRGRHHDCKEMAMHFDDRSSERAVFCNGIVHWIRYSDGRTPETLESDVSHYFDLADERLGIVSSPPVSSLVKNIPAIRPTLRQRYLGESGGHLYLIETYKHCLTQFFVIEMETDYSGWFIKYLVDLNPLVEALPGLDWNAFVVLGLFREEKNDENEEEDSSTDLWLHMPGNVICYNLRNKAIKKFVELANKKHFLSLGDNNPTYIEDHNYPYIETLACV